MGIVWHESWGSLSLVLFDKVSANCAGLVQDETIVVLVYTHASTEVQPQLENTHNVWDLTKGVKLFERGCLVLTLVHSDADDLVWNLLFSAHLGDEFDGGCDGMAINFENHDRMKMRECEWMSVDCESRPTNATPQPFYALTSALLVA